MSAINPYYLKNRGVDSKITDSEIRALFEKRMTDMNWNGDFERGLSGCYWQDDLQQRWEEFYNGFRLGEDYVSI